MGKIFSFIILFNLTPFLFPQDVEIIQNMVFIQGSTFLMGIEEAELVELAELGKKVPHMSMVHSRWWFGDEMPVHNVTLESFFIDIYEVTNAQYFQFVKATDYVSQGEWAKYATEGREDHPVINVTWNDAAAYAKWAGKRLPSEAEWEYAARGGSERHWFPWGNEPDPKMANYRFKGESFIAGVWRLIGLRKINTKSVGSYPANGFGLYDMIGNVSEWMSDYHRPYTEASELIDSYRQFGPWGEDEPNYNKKVVRGGGWDDPNAVFIRITGRSGRDPETYSSNTGFRCVKSVY